MDRGDERCVTALRIVTMQASSAEHESAGQLGSVAAQCVAGGDSPIVVKIGLGSSGRTAQAHLPLSKLDRDFLQPQKV